MYVKLTVLKLNSYSKFKLEFCSILVADRLICNSITKMILLYLVDMIYIRSRHLQSAKSGSTIVIRTPLCLLSTEVKHYSYSHSFHNVFFLNIKHATL